MVSVLLDIVGLPIVLLTQAVLPEASTGLRLLFGIWEIAASFWLWKKSLSATNGTEPKDDRLK